MGLIFVKSQRSKVKGRKSKVESQIELDRTLIIILFGAEEVGLVGAQWFVDNFSHPTENIKMMVNLDMVGRIPTIHFGTRGALTPTLYHVPEDTMEIIDIEIMRDVMKLLTMSIIEMGNAESLETKAE